MLHRVAPVATLRAFETTNVLLGENVELRLRRTQACRCLFSHGLCSSVLIAMHGKGVFRILCCQLMGTFALSQFPAGSPARRALCLTSQPSALAQVAAVLGARPSRLIHIIYSSLRNFVIGAYAAQWLTCNAAQSLTLHPYVVAS